MVDRGIEETALDPSATVFLTHGSTGICMKMGPRVEQIKCRLSMDNDQNNVQVLTDRINGAVQKRPEIILNSMEASECQSKPAAQPFTMVVLSHA